MSHFCWNDSSCARKSWKIVGLIWERAALISVAEYCYLVGNFHFPTKMKNAKKKPKKKFCWKSWSGLFQRRKTATSQ